MFTLLDILIVASACFCLGWLGGYNTPSPEQRRSSQLLRDLIYTLQETMNS